MILPAVIRIFFALELPESIKDQVGEYISVLRRKAKPHAIRWTRTSNLHITLQFLGAANSEDVPTICKYVRDKIKNKVSPLTFSLRENVLFPSPYRPRVIVLSVFPQESLDELASLVGAALAEANYVIEARPFRAHMTLGRIKQPKGLDLSFLKNTQKPVFEPVTVSEMVLFRSEPSDEGSFFTALERFPLNDCK